MKKSSAQRVSTKVDIKLSAASPAARAAWQRFWQKVIVEAKANEREGQQKQ